MCEWVDICPWTGKAIKDAPCKAIQNFMDTCATNIGRTVDSTTEEDTQLIRELNTDAQTASIIASRLRRESTRSNTNA